MKLNFLISRTLLPSCLATALVTAGAYPSLAQTQEIASITKAKSGQIDAQAWQWRLQPVVGSRYRMRLFSRTSVDMSAVSSAREDAASPDKKYVVIQKAALDMDVIGCDALGATTYQITFRDIESSVSPKPQVVGVPRTQKGDAVFRKMVLGKPFQIKLGPSGHYFNSHNYGEMTNNMLRAIEDEEGVSAGMTEFLSGFTQHFATLMGDSMTTAPIRVSENWEHRSELPNFWIGILAASQGQDTLKSLRNGVATVTTTAKATVPPEMPIPYDISGTISQSARIDAATGLTLERDINAQLLTKLVSSKNGRFILEPVPQNLQIRMVLEPR